MLLLLRLLGLLLLMRLLLLYQDEALRMKRLFFAGMSRLVILCYHGEFRHMHSLFVASLNRLVVLIRCLLRRLLLLLLRSRGQFFLM